MCADIIIIIPNLAKKVKNGQKKKPAWAGFGLYCWFALKQFRFHWLGKWPIALDTQYEPCLLCVGRDEKIEVPNWYRYYLKVKKITAEYEITIYDNEACDGIPLYTGITNQINNVIIINGIDFIKVRHGLNKFILGL